MILILTHAASFGNLSFSKLASLYPRTNQSVGIFSPFDATAPSIRIEAECLDIDTLRCSDYHSQILQPDHFVSWRQDQRWQHSHRKNKIRFPWFFRSFNKWVFLSGRFWTIVELNRERFLEHFKLFNHQHGLETEIFFFCASFVIFWHVLFLEAFLWLLG